MNAKLGRILYAWGIVFVITAAGHRHNISMGFAGGVLIAIGAINGWPEVKK